MRRALVTLVLLVFAACQAPKPFAPDAAYTASPPSRPVRFSGGDGSSTQKAIVVHTRDKGDAILAEYAYIRTHYGPYETTERGWMLPTRPRLYDMYQFITRDGKKHVLYFDITQAWPP